MPTPKYGFETAQDRATRKAAEAAAERERQRAAAARMDAVQATVKEILAELYQSLDPVPRARTSTVTRTWPFSFQRKGNTWRSVRLVIGVDQERASEFVVRVSLATLPISHENVQRLGQLLGELIGARVEVNGRALYDPAAPDE